MSPREIRKTPKFLQARGRLTEADVPFLSNDSDDMSRAEKQCQADCETLSDRHLPMKYESDTHRNMRSRSKEKGVRVHAAVYARLRVTSHERRSLRSKNGSERVQGAGWAGPTYGPVRKQVNRIAELGGFPSLCREPFDFNHPLWTIHIVEEYEGGAAVVLRWHHAMADGAALVGVIMALVDGPVGESRRAAPPDEDEGWLQSLMAPVVAAANAGTQASTSTLGAALDLARHPLRAVDYLRHGAGVAGELAYLISMKSDSATRFKGKPTGSKRAAWCEPLKLSEVKAVSRALGCSINDVLLSCAAGAMRRYLADKGDRTEGVEIRALAPIDLREPGDISLGNRFGIVAVLLPVGVEHPLERLMMVRQRMLDLKTSYEPTVTLGLFAALGYLPKIVQDQLSDMLASHATAVMTNVPGPTEPLTVAGSRLRQMLFWVPQSGDIGMGVSILSYAGQVQFGLMTDDALTPDPEAVVSRFDKEFEQYLYYVLLDPPEDAVALC